MDGHLLLAIVAGIIVIAGQLFLSMIHLFMIPKDVMDRDTKPRRPKGEQGQTDADESMAIPEDETSKSG